MKKYRTHLKIEVEAENEDEAVKKMYELMSSGELSINDLEEV